MRLWPRFCKAVTTGAIWGRLPRPAKTQTSHNLIFHMGGCDGGLTFTLQLCMQHGWLWLVGHSTACNIFDKKKQKWHFIFLSFALYYVGCMLLIKLPVCLNLSYNHFILKLSVNRVRIRLAFLNNLLNQERKGILSQRTQINIKAIQRMWKLLS